ncbi:MAG: GNAT family N-acetyltransferase [Gemmatimonadaceae bacterium]|nr:GNAT family N-acetyltransferase [Gemmatimonadaceae bacterium]
MPVVSVERTYLRLGTRAPSRAPDTLPDATSIHEAPDCTAPAYRALYSAVGATYNWRDRLAWSDQRLDEHLRSEAVRIWVLRDAHGAGGYFELHRHPDDSIEIAYFGLVASRHGRGLGRALLTRAIDEAWRWGATSVWLHTCTLDDPAALPNYRARGFEPFRSETYEATLPDP